MAQTVQPMTNLQLCNMVITKCGISGSSLSTTANTSGEMARVVAWVNEAYLHIQEIRDDWDWMQGDVSFSTVASQGIYPLDQIGLTDFAAWSEQSFRVYFAGVGYPSENFLEWLEWPDYRDTYLFGNLRLTSGMPLHVSQRPEDHALCLGLAPNAVGYTIDGRYFKVPQSFASDGDVPSLPARYHMLIVYRAMMSYGKYEAASEVLTEASDGYKPMLKRLISNQQGKLQYGIPLA